MALAKKPVTGMKDILPECTSIEAYLPNKLEGNLVSLTTVLCSSLAMFF